MNSNTKLSFKPTWQPPVQPKLLLVELEKNPIWNNISFIDNSKHLLMGDSWLTHLKSLTASQVLHFMNIISYHNTLFSSFYSILCKWKLGVIGWGILNQLSDSRPAPLTMRLFCLSFISCQIVKKKKNVGGPNKEHKQQFWKRWGKVWFTGSAFPMDSCLDGPFASSLLPSICPLHPSPPTAPAALSWEKGPLY